MAVTILYFGLIAETINTEKETIEIEDQLSINGFKDLLISKYETLKNLSYQIALNQQIVSENSMISNESEIAILPPFAGG